MSYRFADSCQQTCMTYSIAVCTVKTPEDGQRKFPKHVEFYSKNTFEKSVHLVGIRWAGHVVRMGEERGGGIGSCWGNRMEGNHWGDLGLDGWIILGWISRGWNVG